MLVTDNAAPSSVIRPGRCARTLGGPHHVVIVSTGRPQPRAPAIGPVRIAGEFSVRLARLEILSIPPLLGGLSRPDHVPRKPSAQAMTVGIRVEAATIHPSRRADPQLADEASAPLDGYLLFSFRQPPARLFAMICRSIAVRAGALIDSFSRIASVRAVLFSWPAVMIPSGSGTIAPS